MNRLFEEFIKHEGEGYIWNIGRVKFQLNGSLIVLTSDSVPLVYLLGSKGGSGVTRAAMEWISSSDLFGTRFRQHEIVIHVQEEFHERLLAQRRGEFGTEARDQPQTRDCTCASSFTVYRTTAKNVTSPGGGGFHMCPYVAETLIDVLVKKIPLDAHTKNEIRRVLDVRQSLMSAGEMTNSVQMLLKKFSGCAPCLEVCSRDEKIWNVCQIV